MNNKKKILLVEDDQFISEIYYKKLIDSGFDVKLTQDGFSAVSLFEEFQPDVVLLDIMLPKKSGWEVLEEISRIKKVLKIDSKIIMLTNLGEKEKIEQALKMGAEDYLIKASLIPSELVEMIKDKIK